MTRFNTGKKKGKVQGRKGKKREVKGRKGKTSL